MNRVRGFSALPGLARAGALPGVPALPGLPGFSALPALPGAGIDVVDLSLTDPARSPRLAPKMLAPSEYVLRPASMPFHTFLWLCWSVKEAVYKFRRGTFFQPTRIVLDALDRVGDLRIHSCVSSDYILSVVDIPGMVYDIAPLDCAHGDPSEAVRALVAKRYPDWERRPVSFSHHGRYLAYCLQDMDTVGAKKEITSITF